MKVLHVAPSFPPEFRGGVERHVEELCPALEALGVRSAVAAGSLAHAAGSAGEVARELWGAIPVFRLRRAPGDDHAVDLAHPSLEAPFAAVLAAFRPDLVHVHHWLHQGGGLVRRLHARGIPAVVTLHDAWVTCPRFNRVVGDAFCERPLGPEHCAPCLAPLHGGSTAGLGAELLARDLVLRIELACAARVLTPSAAQRELLVRMLPGIAPPDVVPNGATVPRALAAYRPPARGKPVRVGFLGSVVAEKGVHLLLSAVARLAPAQALELHVHGNLPDAEYARRLRASDLAGVLRLHGPYAPSDLPAIAAPLHVAVFPSVCSESYSLVLDEALALGLPVVVAERGALPERIGQAGLCVQPESVDALASVLGRLCAEPEELARLAAAPRPLRGAEDVARDLARVYAGALRGPAPRPDAARLLRASLLGRERPGAAAAELSDLDFLVREQRAAPAR
jgi:glycosyltransferase involved in cell wall biosynthesis